jgi:uncharacterized protein (TIGR03435 family)
MDLAAFNGEDSEPENAVVLCDDGFHEVGSFRETRELPVFALVVDKGGLKLKQASEANPGSVAVSDRLVKGKGITLSDFAMYLEGKPELGDRPILDQTGLSGLYDVTVRWASVRDGQDASGPSLFTALTEQAGLKLVAQKAPLKVLVIDHAEKPSAN